MHTANPRTDQFIYKVLTPQDWDDLCTKGQTRGSALDRADGFIHFSTGAQLSGTLAKHYKGAGDLILAELSLKDLEGLALRWEVSRNGDLFPHLYAPLSRARVSRHWALRMNPEQGYALPDLTLSA